MCKIFCKYQDSMHSLEKSKQNAIKSGRRTQTEPQHHSKRLRCVLETALKAQRHDDEENQQVVELLDDVRYQPITDEGAHFIAETMRQTMLEIAEIKERNLERRHKELMQLLEKRLGKAQENVTYENVQTAETEEEIEDVNSLEPLDESAVETVHEAVELSLEVNPALGEELALEQVRIKLLPQTVIAKTEKTAKSQNEFQLMRQNMLDMQLKKMQDRERKKQEMLQLAQ